MLYCRRMDEGMKLRSRVVTAATADPAGAAPRQMRTVIGGVIRRDHHLSGQEPLHAETPLINVSVLRWGGTQVVQVGKSPIG